MPVTVRPPETSDVLADPQIDARIAAARAHLSARFAELERRVDEVKQRFDPRGWLENPWARVGVAFAVGFVLGRSEGLRPLVRVAATSALSTLVHQAVAKLTS